MPSPETPDGLRERIDSPREREKFLATVAKDRMEAARRPLTPADHDAEVQRNYGTGRLDWLKGFTEMARASAPAHANTLKSALRGRKADIAKVNAIATALQAAPPTYGKAPTTKLHPYLTMRTANAEAPTTPGAKLHMYEANYSTIQADIVSLQNMQEMLKGETYANARQSAQELINMLNTYLHSDIRQAMLEAADKGIPENHMDRVGKNLGRVALLSVLGVGSVVLGTIFAVNFLYNLIAKGKLDVTGLLPFALWLAAFKFAQDPKWISRIGMPVDEKEREEIVAVTSSPDLAPLCKRYDMKGPAWKGVVKNVYKIAKATPEDLTLPPGSTAAHRETLAKKLSTDAGIQATLVTMMEKGDFRQFTTILSRATTKDAQDFIADYIEHDAIKEARTPPKKTR